MPRKMIIGRFSVPEGHDSQFYQDAVTRLALVGVETYTVEVEGDGLIILDLEDVMYIGDQEIEGAIGSFEAQGA